MGVFSRLLGGAPSPERFAKMMEAELRVSGITAPIRFDAKNLTLHIEGDTTHDMYLGNALAEYQQVPKGERRGILQKYATLTAPSEECTLDEVRENLLPRVRQRVFYHANAIRMPKPDGSTRPFPHRVLAEDLAVSVVIDYPDRIQETFEDPHEKWGLSMEEVLEIAADNLWNASQERFQELMPGCWQSPWRDNHDASRLYLTNLIRSLRVKGDHVAMVPNRDTLLVTGSEDEAGLALMAEVGAKEYEDNRSISAIAVTLEGAEWKPFMVTPDHAAFASLRKLRYLTLQSDYAEQKNALEEWHEKKEIDIFVSSLQVFQKDENLHSMAVWSQGVTTLLPVADEVALIRFGPDEKPVGEPVIAKWDRALRVIGHRMKLQEMYPVRYLVESFPSDGELEQMQT